MRIERRFTVAGEDPYKFIEFKLATSEIRNPDGSRVFHLPDCEVPADWSQVACDILAQKYFRKAGVPQKLVPVVEDGVPDWLWRRVPDEAALALAGAPALRLRKERQRSVPPPCRHLDLLGLEGRLFRHRGRCPRLLRRNLLHADEADGLAQLAAMVQHRPSLGLWDRRSGARPLLRRFQDRRAQGFDQRLRAA